MLAHFRSGSPSAHRQDSYCLRAGVAPGDDSLVGVRRGGRNAVSMRSRILVVCAVAAAFAATGALQASATTGPRLYWRLAPPAGATVTLDPGAGHGLQVEAATVSRRQRVSLSLLGSSRARLHATAGNPAVGVLRVPGSLQGIRPFAVTFVARIVGRSGERITRTVIISIRSNRVSLVGPGARSRWAYVLQATHARAEPSARAPIVGTVATATSDGVPNLVRVLVQTRRGARRGCASS